MTYKETITAILECYFTGFKKEIIDSACNRILEQEPKAGHWKRNETIRVTYCSECGFGQYIDEYRTYNYCPNCGARMAESEDKDADSN